GSEQPSDTLTARRGTRLEWLIEVCVLVFLLVPSMALGPFAHWHMHSFAMLAILTVLRDLGLVCLVLYFLWHNHEPVTWLGWTARHAWLECLLGVLLFVPLVYAAVWLDYLLRRLGLWGATSNLPAILMAGSRSNLGLAVLTVAVIAVSEETIFRGYLILRLRALTGSPALAVVLAALLFGLGHGYEGAVGIVTIGFMGLVYGLVYWWRQSLVAPIVMHFLQDLLVLVVLPLLSARPH
ncbi:MAG TPA: type II CAAX endopeptidase family protein, partial [Gemmataceae bacterium]|nr:type II CAAX endopeptidase family protein [Gemmataceae bacterium]